MDMDTPVDRSESKGRMPLIVAAVVAVLAGLALVFAWPG